MLYIKINPCDSDLIATHLIVRLECQGPPGPLEEDLKGAFGLLGGPLKCKYVKFEGLLACYISKSIPVTEKLIATHLIIRLVCQGPPRPLKMGLKSPGGPLKCEFVKFEGLLACYMSKLIPVLGKHILS